MDELQKFIFENLPVRGAIVRLDDAWREILRRRARSSSSGAWPQPVQQLLGEMLAAAALLQSAIRFDGTLILQIQGSGALRLAVAEVRADMGLRATATLTGEITDSHWNLGQMEDARCVLILDPQDRRAGQQSWQGIVPLRDVHSGEPATSIARALQIYMRQSEQLETMLVLAADDNAACGLMLQRMPVQGAGNIAATVAPVDDSAAQDEDWNRLGALAASLGAEELLTLDMQLVLHRLFWNERLMRFAPTAADQRPHFACSCSRERVARMLQGLGQEEVRAILEEQGAVEVNCEFCGHPYCFDAVDAAQLFADPGRVQDTGGRLQ